MTENLINPNSSTIRTFVTLYAFDEKMIMNRGYKQIELTRMDRAMTGDVSQR